MTYDLNGIIQWKYVQQLVRDGNVRRYHSVGDQFIVSHNGFPMVWDIVAIDVATPADTTKTHSMTLMTHNLLPDYMMFDNRGK